MFRSRTEEKGHRSRESESKRVAVSIPINRIRGYAFEFRDKFDIVIKSEKPRTNLGIDRIDYVMT
ncbi:hypothetical protein EPI10_024042 [Gossypium australe]|uniref:Uncharacterized protein n=1 Tax=Gossypium australe TaxID=47621 RepID=A0A5B6VWF8_9ROSI|nr:hypothetical protein EPI10_024042 [Gossypium australe]